MMAASPSKPRQRSWWFPWIIVAFFTVVISVNGTMIYFATSTFTGLDTEGHYAKGLKYNDNLEGVRKQAELGWSDKTAFVLEGQNGEGRDGMLRVDFTDKDGQPLPGLKVFAIVTRPTHVGYDFEVLLSGVGNGVYGAAATLPLPGQWDIRILASRGEQTYQRVQRVQVK